ncbi:MAG: UDP-3-O-(3-hydroxymyristoyl)glucosamine N-acyltransferase [Candidatus Hydrogenedentes bacterium]|nr:UDP-3-O-(3-hydroxymyristoyl)glucosamine N-acyltransferase [Candidatus Hydrogenedentota bacterium]
MELAEKLGARLIGDPSLDVTGLADPASATADDIVVIFSSSNGLANTQAKVAVVPQGYQNVQDITLLYVDEPRTAFATLTSLFRPQAPVHPGIHLSAQVAPAVEVAFAASIGPLCVVESHARIGPETVLRANVFVGEGAQIGRDCLLHPGVVLYPGTCLGDHVTIHANSTIGLDGFAFVTEHPDHPKVHSLGRVVIEDDVEIGAGSGIQRATLGETRIGRGTKIGSQVEIGHNCRLGQYCLLAGKNGLAGSVTLGDRVFMGVGASVRDHVTVGNHVKVMMSSTVTHDIADNEVVLGFPAQPHEPEKNRYKALSRLAEQADDLLRSHEVHP